MDFGKSDSTKFGLVISQFWRFLRLAYDLVISQLYSIDLNHKYREVLDIH
jgi:hypothetical protein